MYSLNDVFYCTSKIWFVLHLLFFLSYCLLNLLKKFNIIKGNINGRIRSSFIYWIMGILLILSVIQGNFIYLILFATAGTAFNVSFFDYRNYKEWILPALKDFINLIIYFVLLKFFFSFTVDFFNKFVNQGITIDRLILLSFIFILIIRSTLPHVIIIKNCVLITFTNISYIKNRISEFFNFNLKQV